MKNLEIFKIRPKIFYGHNDQIFRPPNFLDIQIKSYNRFISFCVKNNKKVFSHNLEIIQSIKNIFPITTFKI